MSNLKLWDSVKKTDPAFTKKASKGAHNFTSVAPMYQNKKATEAFGPQGIGWGVVIGSEVFTEKEYGTTILRPGMRFSGFSSGFAVSNACSEVSY